MPASQLPTASCRKPKVCRPCSAQVCTVEKIRSRNLSPRPERVKNESLRLITKPRNARSAALLVGGTAGFLRNCHSADSILSRLAQVLAVRVQALCAAPSCRCLCRQRCSHSKCLGGLFCCNYSAPPNRDAQQSGAGLTRRDMVGHQ